MKTCFVLALLLASGSGCRREGGELAEAAARAEPHVRKFTDFDRWARRAIEGLPATRASEAASETVFARIRNDDTILAAWVQWKEETQRALGLPKTAALPEGVSWVHLRVRGGLDTALLPGCPKELAALRKRPTGRSCVLLRRSESTPTHGEVVVTVLFQR
jgi:hypothetical protein